MKYNLTFLYDYVMPNYILPNAILTELGIINYLHSLNSNRLQNKNSFFEQSLNADNDIHSPLTFLFGDTLGHFPNSVGGQPSNLFSCAFSELVEIKEDSLYFGKKYSEKYIYPIKITPKIDDFSGCNYPGSKLNGEYFWKHMSAQALEDAKKGKCVIFLDYAQENYIESYSYERLHTCLQYSDIPKSQVVLAFNSFNAKEVYDSWFNKDQQRLEIVNWPFVLSNTSHYYANSKHAKLSLNEFTQSENTIRKNHFLFKIRRPRFYRQALLYKLHNEDLLKLGDWSWLSDHRLQENDIINMNHLYGFNIDADKIKSLYAEFPKLLQDEQGESYSTISAWTDNQVNSYKNTYFYICTETYTHGEHKSVTEKVCKPFANFLPFVFLSFCGALKHLRELGFKTFHPFIDESYDDEIDEHKRLVMVYKEIEKICKMPKEDLHKWYWNMKDIYIHNHNHLIDYYKKENYTLELVKFLQNKMS